MGWNDLTQSEVHDLFDYRDGNLWWRLPAQGRQLHKPVGCLNNKGYRVVFMRSDGGYKQFKVHRLIWLYHHDDPGLMLTDHINGNRDDNRIENLRLVGSLVNAANRRKSVSSSNRYKGVRFDQRKSVWVACLGAGGTHSLGTFRSEFLAALAYDRAATEWYGHYGVYNFGN